MVFLCSKITLVVARSEKSLTYINCPRLKCKKNTSLPFSLLLLSLWPSSLLSYHKKSNGAEGGSLLWMWCLQCETRYIQYNIIIHNIWSMCHILISIFIYIYIMDHAMCPSFQLLLSLLGTAAQRHSLIRDHSAFAKDWCKLRNYPGSQTWLVDLVGTSPCFSQYYTNTLSIYR